MPLMSPPSSKNRKRTQRGTVDISPPSKRTRKRSDTANHTHARSCSPSKNVHFPRNLILGPNEIDPRRRSLSPGRSALRKPDIDSPSVQLLGEEEAVPSRAESTKKKSATVSRRVSENNSASRLARKASTSQTSELVLDAESVTASSGQHEVVCNLMNELKSKVEALALSFPEYNEPDALSSLLIPDNQQLVRYIGLLALGGKEGKQGWQALLSDSTCRRALIVGIVGRALKENVFEELCFGCDDELLETLKEQEEEYLQNDAFFRTAQRAYTIVKHETKSTTDATLKKAIAQVALQLERLLLPLWKQGGTATSWKKYQRRDQLLDIVTTASEINHNIRKDFYTVYYWPPTFKDEEFEPASMECFNVASIIRKSPYDIKNSDTGSGRPVLRPGHRHEDTALVRIVCFPGLVSYQQGGGNLAKKELLARDEGLRRPHRSSDGEGFRTKIIAKSTVLLQWGNQRILTREAGTSAHRKALRSGSQKYKEDQEGFAELYDLFLEAIAQLERQEERGSSASQSWVPNVSRLFSRSPSAQPEHV